MSKDPFSEDELVEFKLSLMLSKDLAEKWERKQAAMTREQKIEATDRLVEALLIGSKVKKALF